MMGTDGRGDVVVVHGHRTVPVRVTSGRPRQKAAKKRNTGEKKRSRGRDACRTIWRLIYELVAENAGPSSLDGGRDSC
jgi:hypothetical protein